MSPASGSLPFLATLAVDDGRGAECLRNATALTVRMARRFQRMP
ncbi:hypothetical protein [Shinella sp. HZN7]|nr:hypothetical protein [Shinella sp. HZN7]